MTTILILILILWALGFGFHLGNLIHLLLLVALVIFVLDRLPRRPLD